MSPELAGRFLITALSWKSEVYNFDYLKIKISNAILKCHKRVFQATKWEDIFVLHTSGEELISKA